MSGQRAPAQRENRACNPQAAQYPHSVQHSQRIQHLQSAQRKRRIRALMIFFVSLIILIIARLGWLQAGFYVAQNVQSSRTIDELSVLQRQEGVVVDDGRGHMEDRNGHALTGERIWVPVLFPRGYERLNEAELKTLASILEIRDTKLRQQWKALESPFIWTDAANQPVALQSAQINKLRGIHSDAVEVLPYVRRYANSASGRQWLGYVYDPGKQASAAVGASGLEKAFEPLLKSRGKTVMLHLVDPVRATLPGSALRIIKPDNPYYPLRLQTTIDLPLQEKIELLLKQSGMGEGAVVVMDVQNADVVAMVSRPFYNPNDIHPEQGQWVNHATQAAAPGSVFKIVTAAAALEAGQTDEEEVFECKGDFGKYGLSCPVPGGHERLTLREGFARSCNTVFAHLAERVSSEDILIMAGRLGLGQAIGWQATGMPGISAVQPLEHEHAGGIYATDADLEDEGVRVQTAIGQRDVMMTPLQAANMVVTLLHEGQVLSPRLVSRVKYRDGSVLMELEPHTMPTGQGKVRPETARQLLAWMQDTVDEGTGRSLRSASWHLAGKSGTAQTGQGRNHQWFVGYGPVEYPKYAVAVLVKNRPENVSNQATRLFGQVMDLLARSSSTAGRSS